MTNRSSGKARSKKVRSGNPSTPESCLVWENVNFTPYCKVDGKVLRIRFVRECTVLLELLTDNGFVCLEQSTYIPPPAVEGNADRCVSDLKRSAQYMFGR